MLTTIIQVILLIVGFIILIKGADFFVEGASSVAGNFRVPKMLIGLTIVAFGTSAPELAVSFQSILAGKGDLVLGNVVGSNILNILLILGVASMFHYLRVKRETVHKELPMLMLLTVLFALLISDNLFAQSTINSFTRSDALVMLLFFAIFLYYLFAMARAHHQDDTKVKYLSLPKAWLYTIGGIIAIVIGSNFVVDSASGLAAVMGVSDKLIALTIVALGTSLPELVTSIVATRRGEYDLAIGNVVGSNIFNLGFVLALPVALVGDLPPVSIDYVDIFVMICATVILYLAAANDRKISVKEGCIFLLSFVAYYTYVIAVG
ncbi:calcium/sodium antiporter [bacterium]|nr:calcium/sodium antiporter [bacterium]